MTGTKTDNNTKGRNQVPNPSEVAATLGIDLKAIIPKITTTINIKKVKGLPFTFPHDVNKMLKTSFRPKSNS